MDLTTLLLLLLGLAAGGAGSYVYAGKQFKRDAGDAEARAQKILRDAEEHAAKAEARARQADEHKLKVMEDTQRESNDIRGRAEKLLVEAKNEATLIREKLDSSEKRIADREATLDRKLEEIDRRKAELEIRAGDIEKIKIETETLRDEQKKKLEHVASLTREEAKAELLAQIEKDSEEELVRRLRGAEEKAKDEADKKAANIIAQAIQRLTHDVTSESTVTIVNLADDSLKGRIIGREGRNITAFEMATGVDVIVDDTPGAVIISGFDLVRREVAKITLERLVADGRIHPARIEEMVKKAQDEVNKRIKEYGEKAAVEIGVPGLHPEVIKLLGRLHYRTSYGQNNLNHAMEVARIGAILAAEVGADVKITKAACLLHDIGKAVSHEVEGPHALIGADLLRKYNVPTQIIHAVEAHHEEVPMESLEAILVQAADAISGARPGARRESLENYIQRLTQLENIATGFPGVDKAFAIQAGREVRIIVRPETIDDLAAIKLSKSIAEKIEKDMAYPGQIKVNVIRETRAVDYAK